jgi:predicted metal-binding membrane protein
MAEPMLAGRQRPHRLLRHSPALVPAAVVAATLATWIVTVDRMHGMDAGPGTNLGSLGWFMGVWATMMAAMMLPSLMPITLGFASVSARQPRRGRSFVPTWVFISGYLAAWAGYGLLAYAIFGAVRSAHVHALSWHAQGPLIAGATVISAGLYQLSPPKRRCLRQCRSPAHAVPGCWRPGWAGAARMGFEHGVVCIGCCWGLMLVLFALGVMSIVWMLVVAGLIFGEKVLPSGERLLGAIAVALVVLGTWLAATPASVPGLTQPGSAQAMRATRAMGMPGTKTDMDMQTSHTMARTTQVR